MLPYKLPSALVMLLTSIYMVWYSELINCWVVILDDLTSRSLRKQHRVTLDTEGCCFCGLHAWSHCWHQMAYMNDTDKQVLTMGVSALL